MGPWLSPFQPPAIPKNGEASEFTGAYVGFDFSASRGASIVSQFWRNPLDPPLFPQIWGSLVNFKP